MIGKDTPMEGEGVKEATSGPITPPVVPKKKVRPLEVGDLPGKERYQKRKLIWEQGDFRESWKK